MIEGQVTLSSARFSQWTDNDLNTVANAPNPSTAGYANTTFALKTPLSTISSYFIKFDQTANLADINLYFLDSAKKVIKTIVVDQSQSNKFNTIEPIDGVSYITATSSISYINVPIYELDIYSEDRNETIHDEITNLNSSESYNSVSLSWDIPSDNPNFTGTRIYKNGLLLTLVDKATNEFVDTNVLPNTTYTYKVTGVYSDGYETTGFSKNITTIDSPKSAGEVTSFNAYPKDYEINLSWVNPTNSSFSKVRVYRDNVFVTEIIGTEFKDTSVQPETQYVYKITTISTEGIESNGVTVQTTTLEETKPELEGGGYTKDENGDYLYTWTSPTEGTVKIIVGGQEYKTVSASDKQILIPKKDMKYDLFGGPNVKLVPISTSGKEGDSAKVGEEGQSPGLNTQLPFGVKEFVSSGMGLFALIAPFVLLSLVFVFVPKMRNTLISAFRKDKGEGTNGRRFQGIENNKIAQPREARLAEDKDDNQRELRVKRERVRSPRITQERFRRVREHRERVRESREPRKSRREI